MTAWSEAARAPTGSRHVPRDRGRPDVVVLHGLSGSWRWWSLVAGRLHGIIAFISWGCHDSDASARALAPWLGASWTYPLPPVDLVGHSLGGRSQPSWRQPAGSVRRLALVAPAGHPLRSEVARALAASARGAVRVRTELPTIVADAVRTGPITSLAAAVYIWSGVRAGLRDPSADATRFGRTRPARTPRVAEEWPAQLPHSRFVRLPCGHVPMEEAPDQSRVSLLGFLGDQLPDDAGDEVGLRLGDGCGSPARSRGPRGGAKWRRARPTRGSRRRLVPCTTTAG